MCAESLALSSPCIPTVPFPTPCQKATWKAGGSCFGLVHLKRLFFSAISQAFLAFCTGLALYRRLYWEILPSRGSPLPWSPAMIVDEGRRILTDLSWHEFPNLRTPALMHKTHVVVLLLPCPLTPPDLQGETSLLCAWSLQNKMSLLIWTVPPVSLMFKASARFLHIKQF